MSVCDADNPLGFLLLPFPLIRLSLRVYLLAVGRCLVAIERLWEGLSSFAVDLVILRSLYGKLAMPATHLVSQIS